jgi:hypothetical protein
MAMPIGTVTRTFRFPSYGCYNLKWIYRKLEQFCVHVEISWLPPGSEQEISKNIVQVLYVVLYSDWSGSWSGWRGNFMGNFHRNFYHVARCQHPLLSSCKVIMCSFGCWVPQLSKKYGVDGHVDRGAHKIPGIFKLFKSRWVPGSRPGCTAAERIPLEFADHQSGDTDAGIMAGMYS